jgi:hypothetical protein
VATPLAFPNGGSTALAKLLLSGECTIALNPRVEAAIASALAANRSLVARLGYEVTPPLADCKPVG